MVLDEFKSIDLEKFPEEFGKLLENQEKEIEKHLFKMGETTAQP